MHLAHSRASHQYLLALTLTCQPVAAPRPALLPAIRAARTKTFTSLCSYPCQITAILHRGHGQIVFGYVTRTWSWACGAGVLPDPP